MHMAKISVGSARGASFADIARRVGMWGVLASDSDATVLTKFAAYVGSGIEGGGGGGEPVPTADTYRYGGFATSNILAGEVLMDHEVTQDHTLRANLWGSYASVGSPPSAAWTARLLLDGADIGAIEINGDGMVEMTTIGGLPVEVPAGATVTLIGPAEANDIIGRFRFTFDGDM